ncbi:PREDICTED: poly [ADP-ribose] polymerase 12-like [Nanorana parkeri]|uniref:poly [ADP-ribose] polymerase 12-like n=1 Tax=Nanorana parkeri TaxID=125878 RepID=UPI00085490E6|nr:PREDICTED: poly [ADP-ribose] polymerase 12-like [Nanorana parkeri]
MSDPGPISLRLCKVLCSNGGSMELGHLARALQLSSKKFSKLMDLEKGRTLVVRNQDGNEMVVYTSQLRMCADRNQECTGDCGKLHLCRFFILGGCSRPRCKFDHSIDTDKAAKVLKKHHLDGVTITELRYLLLQNDPTLLPDVCLHYNRGEGPYGSCTYKTTCNKLHLCQHLLQGDCKFGSKCKRSHDLSDDDTVRRMTKWGLAASLVPQILELYLNASAIKNNANATPMAEPKSPVRKDRPAVQRSASSQPVEEICLYFILNSCSFKERCVRDHYNLPYRWQVCIDDTWTDFPDIEAIERSYCDPNSRTVVKDLNYDTMMLKSRKVRRLSTPSSASKPPHFILTTEWLWYWKDEYNRWIEYGQEKEAHSSATITSSDIETVFLSDENASVQFKAGKQSYVLSFKEMMQRNVRFGTERPVCRRPKFVSAEEVPKLKKRKLEPSKTGDKSTPAHWDEGQVPEVGYKLVQLPASSEEYKTIQTMFQRTVPDTQIQSVERIQNLALWEVYQWQKEQMKKRDGGKEVDERKVFHGTSSSLVDAICQHNFDWRICGTHGTSYGKGSYFARDAAYSHRYCTNANSGQYVMFVARTLVGDFIRGSSSYLRPPAKSPSGSSFYDSCVDSESNPSIFVIFEKLQIYPEYLIRYTEKPADLQAMLAALRYR